MQNGFRTPTINLSWISQSCAWVDTQSVPRVCKTCPLFTPRSLGPSAGAGPVEEPAAEQMNEERGRTVPPGRADVADLDPRRLPAGHGCICAYLLAVRHAPRSPLPGHCLQPAAAWDAGIAHLSPARKALCWVWPLLQLYVLGLGGGTPLTCWISQFFSLSLIFCSCKMGWYF